MKIGILSDTHMIKECIDKTIPYLKDCDLIIHAGDNFSDSKYIHNMTKVGIMAVKCNCDFDNVEDESIDADIVIFGHTHTPLNFKKDNIIYLNPGSVSLPRGVDYKSFSIMNLENDNIKIEQIRL